MKRTTSLVVRSLVAILIGGASLATSLQAQSDAITVSIPFPFTVGTQSMAPGTYLFNLLSSQFVLSVRNVKTSHEEVFPVRPESQLAFEPHGHLMFRKSQGDSVLKEVHFPRADTFFEVIQRQGVERAAPKGSSTNNAVSVGQRRACADRPRGSHGV